jgi:hypothetical protein
LALLAVVLGHLARAQIRKRPDRLAGAGMALAGLVLGYASLGIFAFAALTVIPDLLGPGRTRVNASSVVASLRTINVAEVTYASTYPERGYSTSLAHLGPPAANGRVGPEAAGFIDRAMASGLKNGYHFTYLPGRADEHGLIMTYGLHADPMAHNPDDRSFFTDETGVIRVERGKPAGPESPPLD